jgi:predicted aspartyl protease
MNNDILKAYQKIFIKKYCVLFLGCSIAFGQEETSNKLNTLNIDANYNLSVSINDIPIKLKLDTGAAMSTIDTIILNSKGSYLETNEYQVFLDLLGNEKKFPVYKNVTLSLGTSINENIDMVGFNNNQLISIGCSLKDDYNGLFGMDVFFNSPELGTLLIDNENKYIKLGNVQLANEIEKYYEVSSNFRNNQIFLDIKIENKNFEVFLDTGYNGFLVINKSFRKLKKFPTQDFNDFELLTIMGFSNHKETILQGPKIKFGANELLNQILIVNQSFIFPTIGREFVKKYNWIIDFKKETVFIKHIVKENEDMSLDFNVFKKLKNLALVINDKLVVIASTDDQIKKGMAVKKINNDFKA